MITLEDKAWSALEAVKNAPVIAYDVETSGLSWKTNAVVGYVITVDAEQNWYIPVRHGGGCNLNDPNVGELTEAEITHHTRHWFEKELAKAFDERNRKGLITVGHNIKFDAHMSASHGVMLGRNIKCTQITEAILDEFIHSFSLDSLANKYRVTQKRGEPMYNHLTTLFGGKNDKSQMGNYWRLAGNDPMGVEYALADGLATLEVYQHQLRDIVGQELTVIHNLEMELMWTVFRIERRGIKVDEEALGDLVETFESMTATAMSKLPDGFNVRSAKQVQQLFDTQGITDYPRTDLGNPSFPEWWLSKSELGKLIVTVRELSNLTSSFAKPLVEEHVYKGRVHSNLNQLRGDTHGTISGRFSCSFPNMQQVPKHKKTMGKAFRKVFVPDEGMTLHEADYSQCEPRLFAHYSKEPALLSGYNSNPPKDMHAVVADLLAVERDPTAKRMNMGILTGMQPRTFAEHMQWTLPFATDMFNKWMAQFGGIRDFQNQAKSVMKSRGYVKTLLGRRCRLDEPRFAYRATSRIIQGSNADIVKWVILEIDKYLEQNGDQSHLLMTVHDSLVFQTPDGDSNIVEIILNMMSAVQCEPFNLRVPFKVDIGSGKNWSIATYGE